MIRGVVAKTLFFARKKEKISLFDTIVRLV